MNHVVYLSAIFAMLSVGVYCVSRRSMIRVLLGIEIILNSGNLSFIYFSSMFSPRGLVDPLGQSIVFMSIVTGGCVVAVGLVLIVNAYKQYKTTDVRELRRLRW
jgi:NADH:ubiquinone oxidoreductase subunit K